MEYCAKHDKVFREGETCFGCDTEKELKGPDDTIAEMRHAPDEEEEEEHSKKK